MRTGAIRLSIFVILCMCFSCATIVSGSKQRIKIDSTPSVASVVIDGVEAGKTPVSVKLHRHKEHVIKISLNGYKDYELKLKKGVNEWVFLNIAVGGAVGALVDWATGAIYKLSASKVNAQMIEGTAFHLNDGELYIGVALNVDPTLEKIGQMERAN